MLRSTVYSTSVTLVSGLLTLALFADGQRYTSDDREHFVYTFTGRKTRRRTLRGKHGPDVESA